MQKNDLPSFANLPEKGPHALARRVLSVAVKARVEQGDTAVPEPEH
jgi:hypothetical protein